MGRFAEDPDYATDWPAPILEDELRRLIKRGRTMGVGMQWWQEVETLLRQAFSSTAPRKDFEDIHQRQAVAESWGYDEPF